MNSGVNEWPLSGEARIAVGADSVFAHTGGPSMWLPTVILKISGVNACDLVLWRSTDAKHTIEAAHVVARAKADEILSRVRREIAGSQVSVLSRYMASDEGEVI